MAPDQTKKLIMMLVLLVVLAAAWWLVLFGPLSGTAAGPTREVVTGGEPLEEPGEAAEGQDEGKVPTADEVDELLRDVTAFLGSGPPSVRDGLRDPFALAEPGGNGLTPVPGTSGNKKPKEQPVLRFNLSAILWDAKEPMAVINRAVVAEGDPVGAGITVSKIEPTSVTVSFRYWGRQNDVRLLLEPR